jgi:hypothetical protein
MNANHLHTEENHLNGKTYFQQPFSSPNFNGMNGYSASNVSLNLLSRFLLKVSRADTDILKQCPRSDYDKYIVLGWILILMSFYNFFSFTHFFLMCGLNLFYSSFISLLLSLLVLFIDQLFIVSTINDPKDSFSGKLKNNLLRLMFSLTISILIPIPVKLMIFDDAIQKAYNQDKLKISDSLRNAKFSSPEDEAFYMELKSKSKEADQKISEITQRMDGLNKALEHPSCRYFYYDENGNRKFGYTIKGKNIINEIEHSKDERARWLKEKENLNAKMDSMNFLLSRQTDMNRALSDSLMNAHALNFALKYKYYNKITGIDFKLNPFSLHVSDYFFFCLLLSLFMGFLDFMSIFMKSYLFKGIYELQQSENYQRAKQISEHKLKIEAEKKRYECEKLLSILQHKAKLDNLIKEHELELEKIKLDYEKALQLMQTTENLKEAIYILDDLTSKLRKLYNDEQLTVSSTVLSNI